MSELQSTIEFSVELFKFYNVDLFQRGMYQIRCSLRVLSKMNVEIEVTTPEATTGLGSGIVLGYYGACRPFQILYRNEEITLKDVVLFRCHMLVDGSNLRESIERAEFSLIVELWFSDSSPANMTMVSSRNLQLNMSPIEGLHYHLPVLFDYFHLSAVSLTVHAALTALHQPSVNAPKSSKTWNKVKSAQCASLTDPVLPVSSNKIYSRINETTQIHLEAYNVLLDSSNNLKSTIKAYKTLMEQREEDVPDNYDTLIVKHNEYDSTKLMKQRPYKQHSGLAEVCANNIKLWNYFLLTFSCKLAIQQHLSRKHHNLRVHRFAEMFFYIYNPRESAFGCYETKYQNYLVVAEVARRTKYMQMIPPLPIHCEALDGECATLPVIFEDHYQDPYEYKKRTTEKTKMISNRVSDIWTKPPRTIDLEDTNCSCGIEKLWDKKKSSEKTLVNVDTYSSEDTMIFSVPTRHSKSLDQLQLRSGDTLHYSLSNIRGQKGLHTIENRGRTKCQRIVKPTLKNVASEHNIRNRKYLLEDEFKLFSSNLKEHLCNCSPGKYHTLESARKPKKNKEIQNADVRLDASSSVVEQKYEQFNIKNVSNVKQQYQTIVKSMSQTCSESTQNIFRTNSVQSFSPKQKLTNGINKFNSLLSRRTSNKKTTKNQTVCDENQKNESKKFANCKRFEVVGSTSSSTESSSADKNDTGSKSEALHSRSGIRKVRSASCLSDELAPSVLSGAESLPNITTQLEERLYPEMKYFSSSSSSTTSEQSGWITSRSSSIASSTDITNPATIVTMNLENIQKRQFTNTEGKRSKEKRKEGKSLKNKLNIFNIDSDSSNNGFNKIYQKQDIGFPLFKGCEFNQNNSDETFALPPPKQFRDLESPSSSVTNGANEEEINAVDNLLYHVVDTQTNLERPSQFNLKPYDETEDDTESLKIYLKAKKDFENQLNFPGSVYSESKSFASTVPYFHISDEFRIFSPEGMHLVICVHGLDGNSADLRLVKTYLEMGLPGAYLDFLMSERNQRDTFSDFDTMTDRLISEILHYLDTSSIRPTRISFVGHSLGNVIIRSALSRPQMKFLLPRLHTFLSLSGPHLGTLYNSSGLINMGMWFMQKWKKSGSLLQLCMKDSVDPRQSFLYRLSQRSTLHHFKNILLCGSGQDRYVPLHSARIELCKESLKDTSDQGAMYREMVYNILSPIIAKKDLKFVRYDIHHALPNTANALIGRAAHIAVLDSELFIEKFMVIVGIKYFR